MRLMAMGSSDVPGARDVRRQGDRAVCSLGWLARGWLAAWAVVDAVVGILALELALGDGGKATDQSGPMQTIAHGPFSKLLLILLAVGLAGYAAWRLLRAATGHGAEQRDGGGDRVAGQASGIAYALLCVTAIKIPHRPDGELELGLGAQDDGRHLDLER